MARASVPSARYGAATPTIPLQVHPRCTERDARRAESTVSPDPDARSAHSSLGSGPSPLRPLGPRPSLDRAVVGPYGIACERAATVRELGASANASRTRPWWSSQDPAPPGQCVDVGETP
jgi:hypothetical protein